MEPRIDTKLVSKIRKGRGKPLISVIGATAPSDDYDARLGFEVGRIVGKVCKQTDAGCFTGGVDGVGVHAYAGILSNHREGGLAPKFFMLVPDCDVVGSDMAEGESLVIDYLPPPIYNVLAYQMGFSDGPEIVRAGQFMADRREYLASVGDIFVMVNGGYGTLHEAACAIANGKRVLTLQHSGGAAAMLAQSKERGFGTQAEQYFQKSFGLMLSNLKNELITVIDDSDQLEEQLRVK